MKLDFNILMPILFDTPEPELNISVKMEQKTITIMNINNQTEIDKS